MSLSDSVWTDPRCTVLDLPRGMRGPFVDDGNGGILTARGNQVQTSADGGKTWSAPRTMYDGPGPGIPGGGLLQRTKDGVIVYVFNDSSTVRWKWLTEQGEPAANIRIDVWSVRSLDGGKTWVDRQLVQAGYCGGLITMIQASSGEIVVPVQDMYREPGRNVTQTYVSPDDGASWTRSNTIDLGGNGDHDGAYEATLTELRDGRLWMLIRTNWDRFWEAFSDDAGRSWRTIRPSNIDMSSTPGYITRLSSGRLALVWNRLYPRGLTYYARIRGRFSATPTVFQRDEMSIAFSEDDGCTWTPSQVIAKADPGAKPLVLDDGEEINMQGLSYPLLFERAPGEIWVTTNFQGHLRVSLREAEFL